MRIRLINRRCGRIAVVAAVAIAVGGCGKDPTDVTLRPPTDKPISTLDIDGHSLAFGASADKLGDGGTGFAATVAKDLGLDENNTAQPGATLQESGDETDGWGKVLENNPRPGKRQPAPALPRMAILWYGANDTALYGSDVALAREAYRTIISRHRASAVYEAGTASDPSIEPDTSWKAVEMDRGDSSGGSVLVAKKPGSIKIRIKDGLVTNGASVDLGFSQARNTSARYTISVDGKEDGTLETVSPLAGDQPGYRPESSYAGYVYRMPDLGPGSHEIEINLDQVDGEALFDYWQIEPPNPEPVVLVKQYMLPSFKGPAADLADPDDYRTINEMVDSLAEEFGDRVITVETDSVINHDKRLLWTDGLHLNQRGHDAIARAVLQAIRASDFAGEIPAREDREG